MTHQGTPRRARRIGTLLVAATVASLATAGTAAYADSAHGPGAAAPVVAVPDLGCSEPQAVVKTFESGSSWAFCAVSESQRGTVLKNVWFKAEQDAAFTKVLDELALGQLNVPYDHGGEVWNDVTTYGFGKLFLQSLSAQDCPATRETVRDGSLYTIPVEQTWEADDETWTAAGSRTIPGICVADVSSPLGARSHEQTWGDWSDNALYSEPTHGLQVYSVSKVDWYEYVQKFTFSDNGSIEVSLGATGDISPNDFVSASSDRYDAPECDDEEVYDLPDTDAPEDLACTSPDAIGSGGTAGWPLGTGASDFAANHWHNAIWKVDFGIDGSTSGQVATRYTSQFDGDNTLVPGEYGEPNVQSRVMELTGTPIATEASFGGGSPTADGATTFYTLSNPASLNADGHARGYDFVFGNIQTYDANPVTSPLITFSQADPCEVYASYNVATGDCAASSSKSLVDYVSDGQTLTDPVAWVNVGFHHVVRDEDQSPMPTHWQAFTLYPRDFTATAPVHPENRACVNGDVGATMHSVCVTPQATSKPRLSQAGNTITASPGTWTPEIMTSTINDADSLVDADPDTEGDQPFVPEQVTAYAFTYQWLVDGRPHGEPTEENTLDVTKGLVGKKISVTVTAQPDTAPGQQLPGGSIGTATSTPIRAK
jgi:primary-amine oxidase